MAIPMGGPKNSAVTVELRWGRVVSSERMCRYPPTTSGQHLLDKYAQTHSGYDAMSKHPSNVLTEADNASRNILDV